MGKRAPTPRAYSSWHNPAASNIPTQWVRPRSLTAQCRSSLGGPSSEWWFEDSGSSICGSAPLLRQVFLQQENGGRVVRRHICRKLLGQEATCICSCHRQALVTRLLLSAWGLGDAVPAGSSRAGQWLPSNNYTVEGACTFTLASSLLGPDGVSGCSRTQRRPGGCSRNRCGRVGG